MSWFWIVIAFFIAPLVIAVLGEVALAVRRRRQLSRRVVDAAIAADLKAHISVIRPA